VISEGILVNAQVFVELQLLSFIAAGKFVFKFPELHHLAISISFKGAWS